MTELDLRFTQLKDLIETTPEEDLADVVQAQYGGVDGVLDLVFHRIIGTFDAAKAGKEEGVFRFDVRTAEGTKTRFVAVEGGTCQVTRDLDHEATVTMVLELSDFLALATGRLVGADAYMSGKLQATGEVFFAMNWSEWFSTI
jgi:hypothetical protein